MRNLLVVVLMFFCATIFADELVPIPALNSTYIIDQAGIINKDGIATINKALYNMDKVTGKAVMTVIVVPSTNGEPIEQFTMRAAEAWKIGHSGKQDGIVFAVAVKDHHSRLEVARGLSGDLTDMSSKIILKNGGKSFKNGNFEAGILAVIIGVDHTLKLSVATPVVPITTSSVPSDDTSYIWLFVLVGIVIGIAIIIGIMESREMKHKRNEQRLKTQQLAKEERDRERAAFARSSLRTSMLGAGAAGLAVGSLAHKQSTVPAPVVDTSPPKREEEDSSDGLVPGLIGLGLGLALGSGSRSRDDDDSSSSSSDYSPSSDSSDSSSSSFDGGGSSDSW